MQSEIPDDVMKAARASTVAYFNSFGAYAEADAVSNKDRDHWGEVQSAAWAIMAERERCKAALSAAEPSVAVKALDWNDIEAYSPTGHYRVQRLDAKWEPLHNGYYMLPRMYGVVKAFDTQDEAKAHCQNHHDAAIRSALTAQVQDVAVPEGWQLVPIEPTDEMLQAMYEAMFTDKFDGTQLPMLWEGYGDMLAAAPAKQEVSP